MLEKFRLFTLGCSLILAAISASAQNKIEGIWYNEEKDAKIQIYKKENNLFYGKVVWLAEPKINGQQKTDVNNGDKKLRTRPIIGLHVLKGFKQESEKKYEGGTIYDPKNGKTYSCNITYKDANTLYIRGYIGVSLLGRTTTWTKTAL